MLENECVTSVTQDAFGVCFWLVLGPAASFQLSAAGILQHQDIWKQESLQHDSDEHHQHGRTLHFLSFISCYLDSLLSNEI